jgi:hypothetical protein
MLSNASSLILFFSLLGYFGAVMVIIGVVLEAAELIVKWGGKRKFRKWIGDAFLKSRRRKVVWCVKYIKPRILPYETLGFVLLFIGLAIELIGSGTAERIQSKENASLEATNMLISLRIEELRKANDELETKSRWREITQKQKENFIKSTKNVRKFGIRVRYGTHDAEVQSFGVMIMEMLNSAGFNETNVAPLQEWPPGMNLLYVGGAGNGQMPSVNFLNNVQITNAPVESSSGNEKNYYVMPDGSAIEVNEFRAIFAQTNSFSYLMGGGDVSIILQKTNYELLIPPHSVGRMFAISDPNVTKIWDFLKIRAIFDNIGITAEWTTATNLAAGTCEIFVNPKN